MKKNQTIVAVFFCSSIFMIACTEKKPVEVKEQKVCISDSMQKMISLDTAKISNINDELSLSGEVSFDENKVVKVYPFSSGQIVEVKVTIGDKVEKGQTLAILRSADIAGNYSDLKSSGSDMAIAKREYDNTKSLYEKGISSERELTISKENLQKAISSNEKINDLIKINGGGHTQANGSFVITSPTSGYVVEKNINTGGYIRNDNNNSLFTISNLNNVWVWANVFEADILKVKEGYDAQITTLAYPGKVFHAKIDKVSEVLDPQNKVMRVRMNVPNDNLQLKPEMFTNVIITNKEAARAVSIPSEAVLFDNSKKFVVIYHDKCNLDIREVEVLKSVGTTTYIKSGLESGDVVISKNQILLYRALLEK
ncbi:MAG: efflux RND transporter periplasmic adaptor subunit [Bacteroidota bacterium]